MVARASREIEGRVMGENRVTARIADIEATIERIEKSITFIGDEDASSMLARRIVSLRRERRSLSRLLNTEPTPPTQLAKDAVLLQAARALGTFTTAELAAALGLGLAATHGRVKLLARRGVFVRAGEGRWRVR
jgi:hypothetical protein